MRFFVRMGLPLVVLGVFPALARAQTAGMVSFQGLIRDSGGTPIPTSQPVDLEFTLWTDVVAGSQVAGPWTQSGLTPNGGIVNTKFGPVAASAFNGCTPGTACRWLQVRVTPAGIGNWTTLSRTELVTPPGVAEQVNRPATGTSALVPDANGNLGIGTTTSLARVDAVGSAPVEGNPNVIARFRASESGGSNAGVIIGCQNGNAPYIADAPAGGTSLGLGFWTNNSVRLKITPSGTVGIGAANPLGDVGDLHLGGATEVVLSLGDHATASNNVHWVLNDSGGQRGLRLYSGNYGSGTPLLTLANSGNVGIGTVTPSQKLDVVGNATVSGTVTAASLSGNGSGLTSLNASNVSSGTLSDARLSGNILRSDNLQFFEMIGGTPFIDFHNGNDPADFDYRIINDSDQRLRFVPSANNSVLTLTNARVGIMEISPAVALEVGGAIRASGNISSTGGTCCGSDSRLKKNIQTLRGSLDKLLAMRGVRFQWKDPSAEGVPAGPQIGLVAQEVESVMPELVVTDEKGFKYINTTGFPGLTVEAIRELKKENDELKARLTAVESALAKLQAASSSARASGK